MTDSSLSVSLLALAAVVVAMAALPWLLRRLQQRANTARGVAGVQGQVLHAMALGPGQRVVTVELERDGERTCLVLGVSPQHIQCLHVWGTDPVQAPPPPQMPASVAAPASFAQALQAAPKD